MTKRQLNFLGISIFIFALAIIFDMYSGKNINIGKYTRDINEYIHQQEAEIDQFFNDKEFIHNRLQPSTPLTDIEYDRINLLESKDYTLCIYRADSLVFWTNNNILPPSSYLSVNGSEKLIQFEHLSNGYYEIRKQSYKDQSLGDYTVFGIIPIKQEYSLESDHLLDHFSSPKKVPLSIGITNQKTAYDITTNSGKNLCYLEELAPVKDNAQLRNSLLLYLCGFLFLALFLNDRAKTLGDPDKKWMGAAFLMISFFGIRLLTILFDFSSTYSNLQLFQKNFTKPISSSLGDLLINIVLLLWIMIFYHRQFPVKSMQHHSKPVRFGLASLFYFSTLMGTVILTAIFKNLVLDTKIVFNFNNVFNLDRYSVISILGVILSLIAMFLFSHRMVNTVAKTRLSRNTRLLALGLASLSVYTILSFMDLRVSPIYILLIAIVFTLMFDLFVDHNSTNFAWLVMWLLALSAFPSILLFKYNGYKDRLNRISHAEQLSILTDKSAELAITKFKKNILDQQLNDPKLVKPYPFEYEEKEIKQYLNSLYTQNEYLFYNYTFEVDAFHKKYKEAAIKNQSISYEDWILKINNSRQSSNSDLRFRNNSDNKASYLMEVNLPARNDNPITLAFEFNRSRREQSKVYTELLVDKPFKNLKNLSSYDYAIYNQDGQYIDGEGGDYNKALNIKELPPVGSYAENTSDKRSDIVFHNENGNVVIIGKEKETFIKAISLFSYIFVLLVGFVFLFSIINTLLKIFPSSLAFPIASRRTLKYRIQLWVISLVLVSFVIIGTVSIWFFSYTSEEYHEKRLSRKTSSVLNDALHELETNQLIDSSNILNNLVKPLSIIHRMDINLYNTKGHLIESSEDDIFNRGVVTRQMGATAFYALRNKGISKFTQEEKIGSLQYKSAYVPLKIRIGQEEKTVAYLGLPYYSKQSKLRSDVTVFMSTLLNAYVFLLLIAGGIAIVTANSITRPLAVLGEKLKEFKLGKDNEPLEWKTQDELGDLINEYNKMIAKLEESADKLAQSAQEGAWREMAKQVAHEIKNPLTPMKLSIQYLQHAYRSNPDNIEPLLKRVSGTMIEQIDNLAHIANEFSNFAKMPRAENKKTLLNKMVQSVPDLMSKEREDVILNLDLPIEQFFVYADKNHLMRVLNNIVKNAIQAIPDERQGRIDVQLFKKDDYAIIKISDNGGGIPEEIQDHIFEPYFSTKNSGTGLGMAMSKNIIESINGEIYFETESNIGTDFFVKLPIIDIKILEEV